MSIQPYPYIKGKDFNQRLLSILNKPTIAELSRVLVVPQTTFATWQTHDRTSHELMLRLHIEYNTPLEAFLENSEVELPDIRTPIIITHPKTWLVGSEFVNKLKEVLNCDDLQCLSDKLNVKKTTFSTWSTHNRTSHELIVRLALAGITSPNTFLIDNKTEVEDSSRKDSYNLFDELDLTNPTVVKLKEFMDNEDSEIIIIDGKPLITKRK